ncbi:MAG: 5-bromo-4-chloroindolyl phosphate hydrolysis family protein, partial [Lachnospiraceae bacterium]|nr:5-bromo-4-chloroindolyl phosphate hydrolysis family protein [Lachnospiraceae bacterium]
RHIHECNERIPGEEMTEKLNRLELVVTRIFREAGKNPDAVSDLRKMMSYYLPTTQKLLDAYCELDDQPIRGQNIETTRREIEGALDTLNTAFENLLDSLYEEQAWDISSDISVLNTMLAQEGLTKKDFEKKEQKT